jgi:hypothetical protein
MGQDILDDWIASLLSIRSNREIAKLVHVGHDYVDMAEIASVEEDDSDESE